MRSILKLLIFAIFVLFLAGVVFSFNFNLPKWFPFSTERSLDEWEEKIFKGRVLYKVDHEDSEGFLHALSRSSASAIYYRIYERFNVEDYPLMSWKWKVIKFPDKEKLKLRQGIERDDYAARVYVIFPSINFMSSKALEYVWDESIPVGIICQSPYSGNIRLIVVQTGKDEMRKWVFEERNIYEDYQRAFGSKPTLKVGAIALMSDADNTEDVVEAYFDEIRIGYTR
jgi:hypothetical protein